MKMLTLFLTIVLFSNGSFAQRYLFFLHNRFTEDSPLGAIHPQYGKSEYPEIVDTFKSAGFEVISEKRASNTDPKVYAHKVVSQINSLLKKGIHPGQITIVGTSKGGYIAQFISTYLANPDVNFVFIGCYRGDESDFRHFPDINFCGNILTIYEESDEYGVSAIKRKENSKLKVTRFKEIELHTGLKHGFLFKPLKLWIDPTIQWANQNYN